MPWRSIGANLWHIGKSKIKDRLAWANNFRWKWVNEGNLAKLLWDPFGFNSDVQEGYAFLVRNFTRSSSI
jgi:hypothetical protein